MLSHDKSLFALDLKEGGEFFFKNPDGTEIRAKGPGTFKLDDTKTKGGALEVDVASLKAVLTPPAPRINGNIYGLVDDPTAHLQGQITSGEGTFHVLFSGFSDVPDTMATFTASLVSDGTNNPIDAVIHRPGDQLAYPTPGTISYVSRWRSNDVINLGAAGNMVIGDFFLNSGPLSAFEYDVVGGAEFHSTFTMEEDYIFVYDANGEPTGSNVRSTLIGGSVTKDMSLKIVPEPGVVAFAIMSAGSVLGLIARKRMA